MMQMKKIIALVLCAVLFLSVLPAHPHVEAEESFVISLGTVQANPGGEVTLDLVLENNPGFQVLGVGFSYDTEHLELIRIENKAEGLNMTADQSVIWDGAADYENNGVLATLTFSVKEGAPVGEYAIRIVVMDACNDAFEMLEVSVRDGAVSVFCRHEKLTQVQEKAPDCDDEGNLPHYTCDYCGVAMDEDRNVLDPEDLIISPLGHSWEDATCTEAKTCTVCGKTEGEAKGHTEGEPVVENRKNATCTEGGSYDTVIYCTVCGEEISRVTTRIPAKGHTEGEPVVENRKDATCTEGGSYDTVIYCTVCGEELSRVTTPIAATGHSYAIVESKDPTATEEGYVTYQCGGCGHSYTETIPATGATVLWGDANGDGVVNPVDATMILRYFVGDTQVIGIVNVIAADVNGDGYITSVDATMVLRYFVGDLTQFPVEKK